MTSPIEPTLTASRSRTKKVLDTSAPRGWSSSDTSQPLVPHGESHMGQVLPPPLWAHNWVPVACHRTPPPPFCRHVDTQTSPRSTRCKPSLLVVSTWSLRALTAKASAAPEIAAYEKQRVLLRCKRGSDWSAGMFLTKKTAGVRRRVSKTPKAARRLPHASPDSPSVLSPVHRQNESSLSSPGFWAKVTEEEKIDHAAM